MKERTQCFSLNCLHISCLGELYCLVSSCRYISPFPATTILSTHTQFGWFYFVVGCLRLFNTRTTITITVSAVISATATTPPMIPAVLSHSVHEDTLSASQTSDAAVGKGSNTRTCRYIIDTHYTLTSGESDGLTVSGSSYITSSDSDSVDSGTLQLVYCVASASETATGALSSSVSLSPHHLPTGH